MIKHILVSAGKYILVFLFLIAPFTACTYAACSAFASGEPGEAWFFIAVGSFFGISLFLIALKKTGQRVPAAARLYNKLAGIPEEPQSARFVPHWFMMAAILVVAAVVLFSIIMGVIKMIWPPA